MSIPIEDAFRHCPRCGVKSDRPGQVPFRCSECDYTQFFGPVAAVGGLIVNEHEQLLLVRRSRNPGKGQWGLPGGFVDRGETIEQALAREVVEETNLELLDHQLLTTFPNQYDYRGVITQVIDLFYVCRASDPESVQLEPDELDDYTWAEPDRVPLNNLAFVSNRKAIEYWIGSRA